MKRFNCAALAAVVKSDTDGRFSNPRDAENGPHPDDCCSRIQFSLREFTTEELKLVPASVDLSDVHFVEFHWSTGQFSGITHGDMVASDEDQHEAALFSKPLLSRGEAELLLGIGGWKFDDLRSVGLIEPVEPIPTCQVAELLFEVD